MAPPTPPSQRSTRLQEILSDPPSPRIEELPSSSASTSTTSSSDAYEDMGPATPHEAAAIAYLARHTVPIHDGLETESSRVQAETWEVVRPFLEGNPYGFEVGSGGVVKLQRALHEKMARKVLGDYPPPFQAMDAARPWLTYWGMQSVTVLGGEVGELEDRAAHTFSLAQHPTGGFGGGFGHLPHLACTYGGILSLAMTGGSTAYSTINRTTMWRFLGAMKQSDGGFTMTADGEEDIRGAYCALVALAMLNLPLELPPDAPARTAGLTRFTDRLAEWVSGCQSWDGGISAAPGNEAHGAYAFCGLACLVLLGPPAETLPKYLDLPRLTHWLVSRQCAPEGGYNGRTNKLVDGCYSHWVGGCWALVEAGLPSSTSAETRARGLSNRGALARYILSAAQEKKGGGLRDKPGKGPDAYHTCYNLAGLSAAQYRSVWDAGVNQDIGQGELGAGFHWRAAGRYDEEESVVWDEEDVVRPVHPVFIVPYRSVYEMRKHFEGLADL